MKYKIIILLSACSLLAACGGGEKPVDLTKSSAGKSSSNEKQLATLQEKPLAATVRLPGQLKPFNEVNIFPKVNGFVKTLLVDRGSVVHKGQLMAVLEAPEMLAQLEAANSRYLQAQETAVASKEKYQRLKEAAAEPGSVSPLELDNAMAKWKADEAVAQSEKSNVNAVKTMEGYLNIYAPFDGMVVQRNVSPGALVQPGKSTDQPMLILQDNRKLRLEVFIPENDVDNVDLAQEVKFTFNAMPGDVQTAKISRSANALSTMRQEAIEIDVQNPKDKLKPGMYAEVQIPMLSGKKSILVPNTAIVRSTEAEYVVKADGGKAKLVDIKEGLASHDSTEVFGDLKNGDKILVKATDDVREGDPIQ